MNESVGTGRQRREGDMAELFRTECCGEEIQQVVALIHQAQRLLLESLLRTPSVADARDLAELQGEIRGVCIQLEALL